MKKVLNDGAGMQNTFKGKDGFTLLELVVVIVVAAILVAVIVFLNSR